MIPMKNEKADTVAAALVEHVILKMGCPRICQSDNGRALVGNDY
jgi:hypothetical protein